MEAEVLNEQKTAKLFKKTTQQTYGNVEAEISLNPVFVIQLQILSNWGHQERVGLTEVEFFDGTKQPFQVDTVGFGDCRVENERGELTNLINGKTKTIKEKSMWSCHFSKNDPIELVFYIRNAKEDRWASKGTIQWLGIWNYNKSLKELDIGAKDIRVLTNSVVTYEGRIEKGCGNQVFEYGQFVPLSNGGDYVDSPLLVYLTDDSRIETKKRRDWSAVQRSDVEGEESFVGTPRQLRISRSEMSSPTSLVTNEWHSKPNSANIGERYEPNETVEGVRPTWFGEFRQSESHLGQNTSLTLPPWLKNYEGDLREAFEKPSNPRGGERTQSDSGTRRSSAASLNSPFDENVCSALNSRQNSGSVIRSADDSLASTPSSVEGVETSKRETSARFGRRAISASNVRLENDRCKPTSTNSNRGAVTLEESLSSLHTFERSHRGRLMDGGLERDILDLYIGEDSRSKRSPKRNLSTASSYDHKESPDGDFFIPELPKGRHLMLNIKTTWGDRHYVGLNGIELFESSGKPVGIEKIWADPSDINVLPEYSNDPRVVTNLINGIYRTKDDTNLWLAPFTPGEDHIVYISFEETVHVALVRIWNYNKSRIHSFRGARDVEMTLDGKCIFKGEIAKACGAVVGELEAFGDTILFTLDDNILERIAANDNNFVFSSAGENEERETADAYVDRPPTGNCDTEERPFTAANTSVFTRVGSYGKLEDADSVTNLDDEYGDSLVIQGQHIELCLSSNWGDEGYIGLTAIQVIDNDDECLEVTSNNVTLNHKQLESDDWNSLSKLFRGTNVTTDVHHMWQAPFSVRSPVTIGIHFNEKKLLSGLRLWNYNASPEDSYKGVRFLVVKVDEDTVSPAEGYMIRRAPGNCHFDFAQQVNFIAPAPIGPDAGGCFLEDVRLNSSKMSMYQEYEPLVMPRGFIFQLQLLSTWGDSYYVGLNGIELYDPRGNKIQLCEGDVAAYPDSVNVLDGISDDVRTPDKLVDGVHDTRDGQHTWLAPILPGVINRVYIIFDYPVSLSMIKLWNYAKTPSRGVKEFAILVDDLLVYHGVLALKSKNASPMEHRTVLFTTDHSIFQSEKHAAIRNEDIGQDVQMTNDSHVVHKSKSSDPVDQALRPFTSLPPKGTSRFVRQQSRGTVH